MSISSMTGFARVSASHKNHAWTWEVKSVNGRGLDVRCRLPGGHDFLEPEIRRAVSDQFHRGHVAVNLQLATALDQSAVKVNHAVLEQLLTAATELQNRLGAGPPSAEGLLSLRGVVEVVEPEEDDAVRSDRAAAMLASLQQALGDLSAARADEGGRLSAVVDDQVGQIAALTEAASGLAAQQQEAVYDKLRQQMEALLDGSAQVPQDRLAQEAAILASKCDVREELDRLRSHLEAARDLLQQDGTIGRRLDFLAQEFNREANTLCAKSQDVSLTQTGIELKSVIDQFREQAQNIE